MGEKGWYCWRYGTIGGVGRRCRSSEYSSGRGSEGGEDREIRERGGGWGRYIWVLEHPKSSYN